MFAAPKHVSADRVDRVNFITACLLKAMKDIKKIEGEEEKVLTKEVMEQLDLPRPDFSAEIEEMMNRAWTELVLNGKPKVPPADLPVPDQMGYKTGHAAGEADHAGNKTGQATRAPAQARVITLNATRASDQTRMITAHIKLADQKRIITANDKIYKKREKFVFVRLFLYVFNFVLQVGNLGFMYVKDREYVAPTPNIEKYKEMRMRFMTTWVILMHILYSVVAFRNDWYEYARKRRQPVAAPLSMISSFFRETLFACYIWPVSVFLCIYFWFVYLCDRNLIFPEFMDQIVNLVSNHIIHTWIAIFALLELTLRPRIRPKNHCFHMAYITLFLMLYCHVFYYTLYTDKIWLYPVFKLAFQMGYYHFFMMHYTVLLLCQFLYYCQWTINALMNQERPPMIKKHKFKNELSVPTRAH